jgi:Tol biopolymer transport system component
LRDQRKHNENRVPLDESAVVLTQELSYQRDKLRQAVWDAINELAESYREAVILHYISGYSYKEIGEMLSVPVSTVHGRLQQAKNQLRKEFMDMVTQLQLEIDSTVHKFLKEHAKQNGVSVEGLIIRLIERYKRDVDSPGIAVRKLWDRSPFQGEVSPDGRYLIMGALGGPNLTIRDLTTGENRELTSDGYWGPNLPHRGTMFSTWSPDGKQIACAWHDEDHSELRITRLDGSEPRVLYQADISHMNPCDWSQDGKFIVVELNGPGNMREIVLLSVADGSVRTLRSLEDSWKWFEKRRISFSPDGRHVVYDRPVEENNESRDLFLLATDGSGEEVRLAENPDGSNVSPFWAPDGKTIVFKNSDPLGNASLWLTQVIDGKQVGEPQLVMRSGGNIWPQGFTREGSLYYGVFYSSGHFSYALRGTIDISNIYFASLDMETGELLSQPTRLHSEGSNWKPLWSPDGERLAYLSRRVSPEGTGLRVVLVIRSMKTGEERELPVPKLPGEFNLRGWSPDGRSFLCGRMYTQGIHLLDVQTGHVTTVVDPHPKVRIYSPVWSVDGKTIFYLRERTERGEWPRSIIAHDVVTGEEKELYPGGSCWAGNMAVSPDGRQLAFSDEEWKVLKVISTEGGEPRELLTVHNDESDESVAEVYPLAWTPDGQHLLFGKWNRLPDGSRSGPPELWRIPAEGGEPEKLRDEEPIWVSFHPDGQRIAYTKRSGGRRGQAELWVMENLLTAFAADK